MAAPAARCATGSEPPVVRALLPLPLVPARDGHGVRAERADRARARRAPRGRARARAHAVAQRHGPEASRVVRAAGSPSGATTAGPVATRCDSSASARSTSRTAAARHPHLHDVEAAVGRARSVGAGGARVLRPERTVARGQPRAPTRASRGPRLIRSAHALRARRSLARNPLTCVSGRPRRARGSHRD